MQQVKLIFLFCLALLVLNRVSAVEDLIAKTCHNTADSRVCESSLRADPRSSTADAQGLIEIMIDIVKAKFTDSLALVNQLIKASPPPVEAKALENCMRVFKDVLDSDVTVAKSAVELHDPKFGVDAMRDAALEAKICGDSITGSGGDKSTLIQRTKFLSVLSNVAASMITTLE